MSIDYRFSVAFTSEIQASELRDKEKLRQLAALLFDRGVESYGKVKLDEIEYWEDVESLSGVTTLGDFMSGDSLFITLSSPHVSMDKFSSTDDKDLEPLFSAMTEERKALMAEIAELFDAHPPEWKMIRTTS